MNIAAIILFTSSTSKSSNECVNFLTQVGLKFREVRLDTEAARNAVMTGKNMKITEVPALFLEMNDGTVKVFFADKIPAVVKSIMESSRGPRQDRQDRQATVSHNDVETSVDPRFMPGAALMQPGRTAPPIHGYNQPHPTPVTSEPEEDIEEVEFEAPRPRRKPVAPPPKPKSKSKSSTSRKKKVTFVEPAGDDEDPETALEFIEPEPVDPVPRPRKRAPKGGPKTSTKGLATGAQARGNNSRMGDIMKQAREMQDQFSTGYGYEEGDLPRN